MTTFVVTGSDLHDAASWAARVTPSKPTAPVLSGLLLDAGDELTISGYDFETRASVVVPALTTEPGRLLLSGRLLTAVAKTVARGVDVAISNSTGAVQVRAGKSEWTLPALPVDDYPTLPDLNAPAGAVRTGDLRRALARVLPVLSRDATVPMLTGIKLESDGDQLTLVGTDRYRLAVATIPWQPAAAEQAIDVLVPGALLDTAARAAGADSDLASVCEDDNGFGLATDTHLVTGRQLGVEYARWRHIVPGPSEHHALVDVQSLAHAAEQAMIAADEAPQVLLAFGPDGVDVSAVGGDRRARATAAADLTGDAITVKVNAGFLRDALTLHGCDKVTIHFGSTPTKPLLVLGDDDSYRHTLVPVRLSELERSAA